MRGAVCCFPKISEQAEHPKFLWRVVCGEEEIVISFNNHCRFIFVFSITVTPVSQGSMCFLNGVCFTE